MSEAERQRARIRDLGKTLSNLCVDNWVPMATPFKNALEKFIERRIELNGGFVSESYMPWIIQEDPLCQMLIKHSHGRMVCAAQDVKFHCECIEAHPNGMGFVRSVEFKSDYGPGWGKGKGDHDEKIVS